MSVRRIAVLSMHTSPLAQPGTGDGGGMNVYVRALASALARAGVECDVYTRAEHRTQPSVVQVEPGFRVLHVEAGPRTPVPKHALPELVAPFVDASMHRILEREPVDVLHGNYWLSGAVAHRLKHELDLPLVATFHTLARVKAEAGVDDDSEHRTRVEHEVIACADLMLASTADERTQLASLYDAALDRIEVVPPGVDHNVFFPGDRGAARQRLGIDAPRMLLFVGRIQRLKGADLAVRALAALDDPKLVLVIVGGPSGRDGPAEQQRVHALAEELGVAGQIQWVSPRRHERLADYYRAADVCIVPSHSESFGLVALEAAACGTPVVAAAVGGLRSLIDHGQSGFLVEGRDPADYAAPVGQLLSDEMLASEMGISASAGSQRYSWSMTAARLRRLYGDLVARGLVRCD
ncbi:MAG: D-inositol-3-phosphate glycosyltransferase [Actinomycetota bacterium]|nr:D-inositol-3-phosphate glycosyltransferase [Actinomycetota bacterium]